MTFAEVETRYTELKRQWQAGQLSPEQFTEAVQTLRLQTQDGTWWQIRGMDGVWLRWDGASWAEAARPQPPSPPTMRAGLEATVIDTGWVLSPASGSAAGEEVPLGVQTWLGRDPDSHILVNDPKASRKHALIQQSRDGWVITDQGSSNGTFVDGVRVTGPTRLEAGAIIRVGDTEFVLRGSRRPTVAPPPLTSMPLPRPKRRRSRLASCLLLVLLVTLCLGVLGVGGYYLVSSGAVGRRQIMNAIGQGGGEISIVNTADDPIEATLTRLDTESGEPEMIDTLSIAPLDVSGFGAIEPGQYELILESVTAPVCHMQIARGDLYQFVAVPAGIAITRAGFQAQSAAELDMSTSSLCRVPGS